jgi:hypothetical protein
MCVDTGVCTGRITPYISTGIQMTYLQVKDLLLLEEFAFNSPFQIHVDDQHLVLFQVQLQNPTWPIYQT